jgi:FkbM family methyltransferase
MWITEGLRLARMMARVPSTFWARRLVRRGLGPAVARFDLRRRSLELPSLGLSLSRPELAFVVDGFAYAEALTRDAAAVFRIEPDGTLAVQVRSLDLEVTSQEDLYILHEIFVLGTYAIRAPGPLAVLDIGMNSAFASLYFASLPGVVCVHAYEPIPATYRQGLCNLGRNSGVSRKVRAHELGIAASAGTLEVEFASRWKGSTRLREGLGRLRAMGRVAEHEVERVTVSLREACGAVDQLTAAAPGAGVLAKIDCEGMEYEITQALAEEGRLRRLDYVIIEWHVRGPEPILSLLDAAGFASFSLSTQGREAGMIYAARTRAAGATSS